MAIQDLPLPNNAFDGGIVVASQWLNDEPNEWGGPQIILLTLMPTPFYYRTVIAQEKQNPEHPRFYDWHVTYRRGAESIHDAMADFIEQGAED